MATTTTKIDCPRCDGTGTYAHCGVCFRCHGAGKVAATPKATPKPALVESAEAKEARLRAELGNADYDAIFGEGGYWDR